MRADPKIETAGRSICWMSWKPARNSEAMSETSAASGSWLRRKIRRGDLHAVRHQKSRSTYVADIASPSTTTRPRYTTPTVTRWPTESR